MAQQPLVGHGLLIIKNSRSQLETPHSVGSARRRDLSLPENTQHTQEIKIHAPGGIRTHNNPSKRAATDPRLNAARPLRSAKDSFITCGKRQTAAPWLQNFSATSKSLWVRQSQSVQGHVNTSTTQGLAAQELLWEVGCVLHGKWKLKIYTVSASYGKASTHPYSSCEMLAFTLLLRFQITDLRVLQLRSVVHTYIQIATMKLLHLQIP